MATVRAAPGPRPLLEAALMAALGAVLGLLGTAPLLAVFLGFFAVVPAAVVQYRWGGLWGLWSALGANLILMLLLTPAGAIPVGIFLVTVGPGLGEIFRRRGPTWTGIFVGLIGTVVGAAVLLLAGGLVAGVGSSGHLLGQFQSFLNQGFDGLARSLDPLLKGSGLPPAQIRQDQAVIRGILDRLRGELLPSLLLASAFLYGALYFLATRMVLRRLGADVPAWPPFAAWRLPEWVFPAFLLSLVAYLGGNLLQWSSFRLFGENLGLLFFYPLFVQGLAVSYFYLRRWGLGKGMAVGILIFSLFLQLAELFFWFGMVEAVADLRRLRSAAERGEGE